MWLLIQPAFALDWYLESPDRADRREPAAVEEAASAAGFDARVVRRFTEDDGWRYVARVEGFADAASARVAARQLASVTGVALVVIEVEGNQTSRVDAAPANLHVDAPTPADPEQAGQLLRALAAAHGDTEGLLAKIEAGPVRFEYRRTLPDGRTAQHRYASAGSSLYVEVWGDMAARVLRVFPDRAELSVEGGKFTRQQLEPSRALAISLGPTEVIPAIFTLAEAIDGRREFQQMSIAGRSEIAGVETILLGFGGDGISGPIDLEIGAVDHLVRRMTFDGGDRIYEFSDFRPVGGAVLPFSVTVRRNDTLVDRVLISQLETGGRLPEGWFGDAR